jgi:hypothetical protein
MKLYVVYRHGWSDAGQSAEQGLPRKMAVARVEADSPEEACLGAAGQVSVAANQYLTAEPADEVDAQVQDLNRRAEVL